MNIIEVKDLSFAYSKGLPDEHIAVDNINLAIEEGEFVGIIGHTGSGKSTFIQHLNGLLKPTDGEVYIDGENLWENKARLSEFRFKVGLVFQYPEYQLFEETVRADIAFGPKNMGLDEEEISKRVVEAARSVGIGPELLDVSPFDLSGGQKRRVAIAGVIAMRPKVLILDEPTAGLDPSGRKEILDEIERYHEEKKTTVILVSHSMDDVARYASRVMVINESRLFCYDTPEKVFSRSAELEEMGLAIPTVTNIMLELRRKGFDADTGVYTIEDAAAALLSMLKEGGKRA
ncbi:MAG: energy-coupling factor transporter ATPase [Oscillospiraceae bacterium]